MSWVNCWLFTYLFTYSSLWPLGDQNWLVSRKKHFIQISFFRPRIGPYFCCSHPVKLFFFSKGKSSLSYDEHPWSMKSYSSLSVEVFIVILSWSLTTVFTFRDNRIMSQRVWKTRFRVQFFIQWNFLCVHVCEFV